MKTREELASWAAQKYIENRGHGSDDELFAREMGFADGYVYAYEDRKGDLKRLQNENEALKKDNERLRLKSARFDYISK